MIGERHPKAEIIPPAEGWMENTIYIVEVACDVDDPVHFALLRTELLHRGQVSGYNSFVVDIEGYGSRYVNAVHYLKAGPIIAQGTAADLAPVLPVATQRGVRALYAVYEEAKRCIGCGLYTQVEDEVAAFEAQFPTAKHGEPKPLAVFHLNNPEPGNG